MDDEPNIFNPPAKDAAFAKAQPHFGSRRGRILQLLLELGPSTLFEIAAAMELHDHQISGRFTELEKDGWITRTGQRRPKPETGCDCEVYRLAQKGEFPGAAGQKLDLGEALHCPDTLKIGDDGLFQRLPWLSHEGLPGTPYARDSREGTRPRIVYRVVMIECDQCGHPVHLKLEGTEKRWICLNCGRSYKLTIVAEPGKTEMLALVATHL